MRVLMNETRTDRGRTAAALLESHGHLVVGCGDEHSEVVCAALRAKACPLHNHDIDVAVLVGQSRVLEPADEGILCALRSFIPVVVTSDEDTDLRALGGLVAARCEIDELNEAVVTAANAPLQAHSVAAERAANAVLTSAGLDPSWRAVVRREGRRLRLELASDQPIEPVLKERSAIRAEAAIRQIDGVTPSIDVELACA